MMWYAWLAVPVVVVVWAVLAFKRGKSQELRGMRNYVRKNYE